MAGKTFLLKDASVTGYGTLTEGAATAGTMGSGWTVATTTANAFSTMLYGTTRAAATFVTGVDPLSTATSFTTGQAWRSEFTIDGTFSSATNWTFSMAFIAVSTAASQTGRIKARLWKSSSPLGASPTQLTIATAAGLLTGTTAAFTKATAGTSTFSWTPTGVPAFSNEYLFVHCEWNTVVAGTRAGCDAIFVATANSNVVTSNFTAATVQVTGSDSLTLSETLQGLRTTRSTGSDSLTLVDTNSGARLANATAADSLTLTEARSGLRTTRSTASDSLTLSEAETGKRFTQSTAGDSLSLADSGSGKRITQLFVSDSLTLSDSQNFITTGGGVTVTGAISESLTFVDTQSSTATTAPIIYDRTNHVSSEQIICLPISPPCSLGVGALAQLPCLYPPSWIHDKHDGGWIRKPKTKKYKHPVDVERKERKRIREDILEAFAKGKARPASLRRRKATPEIRELPPLPLEIQPAQPRPITPLVHIPSQVDYAGLARNELLARMPEIARQRQQQLESLWTPEELEEEKELEMMLEQL